MARSFHANVLTRLLLIVLVSLSAGWMICSDMPVYNPIALLVVLAGLTANLMVYVKRVNRKIAYFFDAVTNEDFSLSFPQQTGDTLIDSLSQNLTRIAQHVERAHVENKQQEKYFEAMIEHVNVGIMSVNAQGFVVNSNACLRQLLGLNQLTHLRQLQRVDDRLASLVRTIGPNEERTIRIAAKAGGITLLIKATPFRSNSQSLKLVSIQDIRKELDATEIDSWIKLIRVLTHEIMNSIAPVTSLSDNLFSLYVRHGQPLRATEVDEPLIQKTIRGLGVIREQGQGLTRFVETYRRFTHLPKPEFSTVAVKELFEKTGMLFRANPEASGVALSYCVDGEDCMIHVDESQLSQVLINLLKNSAQALADSPNPRIRLHCRHNRMGDVEILVVDNGPGIPPELIDEVFVPFFTTRENGSGIGLSISRQMLRQNNGTLTVRSTPYKETVFIITLCGQAGSG